MLDELDDVGEGEVLLTDAAGERVAPDQLWIGCKRKIRKGFFQVI